MVQAVTIFIEDDKEIEAIRLVPLGSKKATAGGDTASGGGSSQATANASYNPANGQTDVTADVTYDL